jgi:hypothetical protein
LTHHQLALHYQPKYAIMHKKIDEGKMDYDDLKISLLAQQNDGFFYKEP